MFLLVFVIILLGCTTQSAQQAAPTKPSEGWTLHIDAKKHFGEKNPDAIAHHWCKPVSGGLTECQLYDTDAPDAKLIGVEVIVDAATYNKFSTTEKAMWHYHKEEIPKVDAKLPDVSPEEAAKIVKSIEETFGKIYIIWDPSKSNVPQGKPDVTILK